MGLNNVSEHDLAAILTEQKYRKARTNYYEYLKMSNYGYIPTRLHEYIANRVQSFVERKGNPAYDILCISLSPQHGKSLSVSETLPSWYLGNHPDRDVILISYNEDTASRFGRSNRDKLERYSTPPYDVVGPLFKDYNIGATWNNTDMSNDRGKYLRSRGIMGGITSNPAHLIIIDDPIKTMEEARSETTKEKIWQEFNASVLTRLKPFGKVIIIATRWIEDDLIGRVLEMFKGDSRVENIILPLECEDEENDPLGRKLGDPLAPELGRDKAWLDEMKKSFIDEEGLYVWNALYQCNPTAPIGAIIDPSWWKFYDYDEDLPFGNVRISVDTAFKATNKSDFVVILTVGMVEDRYYIINRVRERLSFNETVDTIKDTIAFLEERDLGYTGILIEDKANGSAVIDSLQNEYDNIIPVTPAGGKESRLHSASRPIRQGRVFLPRGAIWTKEFINEFTSFPNGKHDDQVDSLTQVLNYDLYSFVPVIQKIEKDVRIKVRDWTADQYEDYYSADDDLRERLIRLWGMPTYGFNEE